MYDFDPEFIMDAILIYTSLKKDQSAFKNAKKRIRPSITASMLMAARSGDQERFQDLIEYCRESEEEANNMWPHAKTAIIITAMLPDNENRAALMDYYGFDQEAILKFYDKKGLLKFLTNLKDQLREDFLNPEAEEEINSTPEQVKEAELFANTILLKIALSPSFEINKKAIPEVIDHCFIAEEEKRKFHLPDRAIGLIEEFLPYQQQPWGELDDKERRAYFKILRQNFIASPDMPMEVKKVAEEVKYAGGEPSSVFVPMSIEHVGQNPELNQKTPKT
jgi:hypothetical protein